MNWQRSCLNVHEIKKLLFCSINVPCHCYMYFNKSEIFSRDGQLTGLPVKYFEPPKVSVSICGHVFAQNQTRPTFWVFKYNLVKIKTGAILWNNLYWRCRGENIICRLITVLTDSSLQRNYLAYSWGPYSFHLFCFSSFPSTLSFLMFCFFVSILVFDVCCLVITNSNFLLVRLQTWVLKRNKNRVNAGNLFQTIRNT